MPGECDDGPLSAADGAAVARVRAALDRAGYSEPAVLRRLGAGALPTARRRAEALPLLRWRTRGGSPLDILVRLFLLGDVVPAEALAAAIAPAFPDDWARVGLLAAGPDGARAAVELIPYQGLLLAADWPNGAGGGEPVMGVAASTRALADMAVRRPAGRALDLGTGCGVLALLAAGHCGEVVATDLNPRAAHFARFNALLNGRANVACRAGDLFGPARGEQFDLIVCNPPFVIAPGHGRLHTQTGRPADELLRTVVRAAPEHLRDGGYCQVIGNWACVAGEDWRDRLAGWVAGTGCDAWVLHAHTEDAAAYAQERIAESAPDPDRAARPFDEWLDYYRAERIEAVGFGLITLRRTARRPTWFRCDRWPEQSGPGGESVARGFAARDFLEAHAGDEALLAARLRHAPGLRWESHREPSAGQWSVVESRLRLADGLAFAGAAEPGVAEFVARCRGDRPLGEYLSEVARSAGRDARRFAPGFLRVVRRLIELGVLLPAEGGGQNTPGTAP
jgi:hypothetical protein